MRHLGDGAVGAMRLAPPFELSLAPKVVCDTVNHQQAVELYIQSRSRSANIKLAAEKKVMSVAATNPGLRSISLSRPVGQSRMERQ